MTKHWKHIVVLVFVALLIRFVYGRVYPAVILTPDSYSYYGLAREQATRGLPAWISYYRTPVYPMFIRAVMTSTGNFPVDIGTAEFVRGVQRVTIVQSLIAVLAVLVLYRTLIYIRISLTMSLLLGLMHATNMMLIPWERMMLTESLAISWVIFYCYAIVILIIRPKVGAFFLCLLLSIVGVFLRPAFLFLPIAAILFVALYHKKRAVTALSVVTIVYYLFFPFAYTRLNGYVNGYAGLNINGIVNLFTRILEHNFSLEPAKQNEYFYNLGVRFKALDIQYSPVGVYHYLDNGEVFTPHRLKELETFTKTIIMQNVPMYTVYSLQKIPEALTSVSSWIALPADRKNTSAYFFYSLQQLYVRLQSLWPVFFFFSGIAFFRFLRSSNLKEGGIAIFSLLVWQQILVSVIFSADEYARLSAVVIPQFLLCMVYWIWTATKSATSRLRLPKSW